MLGRKAIETVERYLTLCRERKLDEASAYLTADALLIAPGGKQFGSLKERALAARERYQSVSKSIECWDVVQAGPDRVVVYCIGTLFGRDYQGRKFHGVRFIDRFELVNGLISKQEVWNDLGYLFWFRVESPTRPEGSR